MGSINYKIPSENEEKTENCNDFSWIQFLYILSKNYDADVNTFDYPIFCVISKLKYHSCWIWRLKPTKKTSEQVLKKLAVQTPQKIPTNWCSNKSFKLKPF